MLCPCAFSKMVQFHKIILAFYLRRFCSALKFSGRTGKESDGDEFADGAQF